jgi:hypothetical protein
MKERAKWQNGMGAKWKRVRWQKGGMGEGEVGSGKIGIK